MTLSEAIIAMESGEKLTHRWFSPEEWITIEDKKFLFEDGVRCIPSEFWRWRTDPLWKENWEIWKPQK